MRKRTPLVVVVAVAAVVGFMPSVRSPAAAQSKDALSIADNNGFYIDGKSFKVVLGNAGGDVSALIQKLDARDLGPGAIIFRSGDKLYLYTAAAPSGQRFGSDRRDYGSDRRDYGSDRRDYGSERDESPSTAQSEREWREWQQSLRQSNNRRAYGSDRRDYGSDRRDYGSDRDADNPERSRVYINDPEYAQYKLKKTFEDNWTASDAK